MQNTRRKHDNFKNAIVNCVDDLYRFALSICHDITNAEDLVSETVLKAMENKNKLKDISKLKQWMLRMLTNSFIDQRRKEKRVKNISMEVNYSERKRFSLYEAMGQSTFTDNNTPEITLIQKLSNEKIQEAIKQLPETFRIAFVLCEIEELSYQEIAATLKINVGTIRSRIARARGMLQKSLWEHAQETGIKIKVKIKKKEVVCDC